MFVTVTYVDQHVHIKWWNNQYVTYHRPLFHHTSERGPTLGKALHIVLFVYKRDSKCMVPRRQTSTEMGGDSRAKAKIDNDKERNLIQKDAVTLQNLMSHQHGPLLNMQVNARKVQLNDYHQALKNRCISTWWGIEVQIHIQVWFLCTMMLHCPSQSSKLMCTPWQIDWWLILRIAKQSHCLMMWNCTLI